MFTARWSLFAKFAFGISLTVILFGIINAIIVRNSVSSSLNEEFEKRGYFICRALSEQSVSYILSNDQAGLNTLINEILAIDRTISYAFVLDGNGEILAHSFRENVPQGLIDLNMPPDDDNPGIVSITDSQRPGVYLRDFSMAAMSAEMGIARVGIMENEIREQLSSTIASLWLMVSFFLLFGLLAALFFSYTISRPLKLLSEQSARIGMENIQEGLREIREAAGKPYYRIRRLFGISDEIDVLFESYTNMLKRLEQAYKDMNQLQKSLLQSEKMASIGTLTAGVAHEINNPLAGIAIGLKRLEKDPGNTRQIKTYIAMMQEALSRIEQVIKDLLAFSRKESFQVKPANAAELVRQSLKLALYRVKSENIACDLKDETHGLMIEVFPNRMEQVFLNIIINAIDSVTEKINKDDSVKGRVEIRIKDIGDSVAFVFEDNGVGIKRESVSKVFDPFFTTKDVGKGTGLGLSVSYQIVKDHGGDIRLESEEGLGSKFIVILPKNR